MDIFKDCIPSILISGDYKLSSIIEEQEYNPFLVNKALSYHIDCLGFVYELNLYPKLDKKLQYDYLFYSIKKYKRPFKKWISHHNNEDLEYIMKYFNYSKKKAEVAMSLLTREQILEIKNKFQFGLVKK